MIIFEPTAMKEIVYITCYILKNHFFYEEEILHRFLDSFVREVSDELMHFENNAKKHILDELYHDEQARLHFTYYFTSMNLRYIFIYKMHFTEQELEAFENILPKYTEGNDDNGPNSEHKRAYD